MKRYYMIEDGDGFRFDTLKEAKEHTTSWAEKEYNKYVGCYIWGIVGDTIITCTEIKPNRKFGRTITNKYELKLLKIN